MRETRDDYQARVNRLLADLGRVAEIRSAPAFTSEDKVIELLTVIAEQMLEANHTLDTLALCLQAGPEPPGQAPRGSWSALARRLAGARRRT